MLISGNSLRFPAWLILSATLSGCTGGPGGTLPFWKSAPPPKAEGSASPASAETQIARAYYQRVEANYLAQGLLRTDGGGVDTPFGARELAENFLRIVFFNEFSDEAGRLVASSAPNRLHRWQEPVRIAVEFGPTVPDDQRLSDLTQITDYVARLSRLSGHPMRVTDNAPNHTVLIQNIDERQDAARRILEIAPDTGAGALRSVTAMKPDIYCTVFAFTPGDSAIYDRAVTIIRAELPDTLRLACIHEELAQSLGLVDDSPKARPSIFNDNQEFALLTKQDELMLKMLYDPRLTPGMTLREARPIVEGIARELIGGES
ncbi:MAG: DUF2927 domain-containing protein [Rhodobacteraceae bacterium]|nr:DUF2927 domain-containing protein [Paracoccaceae bacterium]